MRDMRKLLSSLLGTVLLLGAINTQALIGVGNLGTPFGPVLPVGPPGGMGMLFLTGPGPGWSLDSATFFAGDVVPGLGGTFTASIFGDDTETAGA